MKNISLVSMLLFLALICFVCCSEDNSGPVKNLVFDTRQPSSMNEVLKAWIFLSDEKGNPLDYIKEVEETYEIVSYKMEGKTPYSITLLERIKDNNTIRLTTVQLADNLDTISSSLWNSQISNSGELKGNAYVDINDLMYYAGSITVGTANKLEEFKYNYNNKTVIPFEVYGENLDCYISITRGVEESKYYFEGNINKGDTLAPKLEDLQDYDSGFDINLGRATDCLRRVYGMNKTDGYCIFNADHYSSSGKFPVRYIDKFERYETDILYEIFRENDVGGWISYTEVSEEPLNAFDIIEPRAVVDITDGKNINYSYSSSAAALNWTWYSRTDYFGIWNYIGEVNNILMQQPIIPQSILDQIGFEEFNFKNKGVSFYNYANIKSYNEYVDMKQGRLKQPKQTWSFIEHYWQW